MSAPTRWMNRLNRQRTNSSGDKKSSVSSSSNSSPPDFIVHTDSYEDIDSGPSTPPLTSSTLSLYSHSSMSNSPVGSNSVLKKSWERHFRSFLTRSNHNNHSHNPKGSKEDVLDVQHRGSYVTPPDSPGDLRSKLSNDLDVQRHYNRRHTVTMLSQTTVENPTVSDAAVRGGSQFQAVFRNKQEPTTTTTTKTIQIQSEKDIHKDTVDPEINNTSKPLSKSYDEDSCLDQRVRRFQSCDSLEKQLHKYPDLHTGSKIDRYKLLAPNQRIPEGGLSKINEKNTNSMLAPYAISGAAIGPGGMATIAQIANMPIDSNSNRQPHRKKGGVQRELKVAFTEIHNSAVDTKSAFLGDEKSTAGGKVFTNMSQENRLLKSIPHVDQLKPLIENCYISLLNPVTGTDAWLVGRRYSLLPAIISLAPLETLSVLLGPRINGNADISSDGKGGFTLGNTILGEADVSMLDTTLDIPQDHTWSRKKFLLAMNYLLEFDLSDSYESRPRGYARLDHATAYPHSALDNVMILDLYMVPCARDERKIFLFQLKSQDEMMYWITLIESSNKLQISNFYEYDTSDDGMILGTGRYATIRGAKKRQGLQSRGNLITDHGPARIEYTNGDVSPGNKAASRSGIMKKKPSFSCLSMVVQSAEFDCALKIINKNLFWDRVAKKEERLDAIVRETAVQATLSAFYHDLPLFLRLKSVFETCDNYVMELEFLDGSDLFRYVSSIGHLAEVEAAHIVRDVLVAICALKHLGIAHRDIKPANIFMVRTSLNDNMNDVRVKLGDFGMAAFVGDDNKLYGRCGTPGYVAPEILSVGVNVGYENKVDVFSLGVTMYILLCGYEPFFGETDEELISANKEAKVDFPDLDWKNVSIEGRDLVEKLLEPDPLKRIDAADALKHPWITRRTTRPLWMENIMRAESS